jgi:hypothetical protein
MKHDWYSASGEGLLATLWMANPMKVALLKPTYVPNRDTHKVWTDISAHEVVGAGYTAGGQVLATKATPYDPANDRTDFRSADTTWGPGATFLAHYAVVYDDSGVKPLWSLLYVVPVP